MKYLHETLGNICPVCGNDLQEPAWLNGVPTWELICQCCGTQFGLDDSPGDNSQILHFYHELRQKWIFGGMKWGWSMRHHKTREEILGTPDNSMPTNWDPKLQLKNIPKEFLAEGESY